MQDAFCKRARRGELVAIVLIGLIGLGLRLVYALDFAGHPLGRFPWGDEGAYWERAGAILGGAWLPPRPFFQDPLFSYWLAGLSRVAGPEPAALRVALACLGALTPLAIVWAGTLGLGRIEGLVAGSLLAVYGPLIFSDGLLDKEGTAALVSALALGLSARAAAPRAPRWRAAEAGLAWGSLALLRANALLIGPVGAAWWIGRSGADRALAVDNQVDVDGRVATWGQRARAGCFLLGFTLGVAPATLINLVVSRPTELIVTTWQAGPNFYIGNQPAATGTYAAPAFVEPNASREADDFAAEASRRAGRSLSPGEVSRFWWVEGLMTCAEAPGRTCRLLARKLGLLLHDREISDNQDPDLIRLVAAPRLSWGAVHFGLLAPLAALGLGVRRSARTPFWGFLVVTSAAGLASTALFFVLGRYRIPWIPGLSLLGAAGAVDLARRIGAREGSALAWRRSCLALPALVLAYRPIAESAPDRWGHAEIQLAVVNLAAGRLEPAIDALDDARALGAGPSERVAALLAEGPVHDALARVVAFRLKARPDSPLARVSDLQRARWLRQLPESRDASRRLLEALRRRHPAAPDVRREWAAWWLGTSFADRSARRRAQDELRLAARDDPADLSAPVLLALLTASPASLESPSVRQADSRSPRVRLARAILADRGGQVVSRERETR